MKIIRERGQVPALYVNFGNGKVIAGYEKFGFRVVKKPDNRYLAYMEAPSD